MIFISVILLLVLPSFSITKEIPNVAASENPGDSEPDFDIPEYISPCNRSDPHLNRCILRAFQHLKPYITRGIPELEVPPLEPVRISSMKIETEEGPVTGYALYTNIVAAGPGNHTFDKVKFDLKTMRLDLHLSIPKLDVSGHYKIRANFLFFPVRSEGDYSAILGDFKAVARLYGVEELRDGVRYMGIEKLLIDFTVGSASFRLHDPAAYSMTNSFINEFLNEYSLPIIEAATPAVSATVAKHFLPVLTAAYGKIPLEVWLRDA